MIHLLFHLMVNHSSAWGFWNYLWAFDGDCWGC